MYLVHVSYHIILVGVVFIRTLSSRKLLACAPYLQLGNTYCWRSQVIATSHDAFAMAAFHVLDPLTQTSP